MLDFVYGMNHGGMVLADEGSSDLRERSAGEFLSEVHGDLARVDDLLGIALFRELSLLDLEPFSDRFLDGVDWHFPVLHVNQMLQHLLRHLEVYGGAGELGIGDELDQRA